MEDPTCEKVREVYASFLREPRYERADRDDERYDILADHLASCDACQDWYEELEMDLSDEELTRHGIRWNDEDRERVQKMLHDAFIAPLDSES